MKSIFTFFVLFSLLSFVNLNYARKEPEDYWKNIMEDQPIPKAIKNLFVQDPASLSDANKMNHFVTDFDTRSNAIIYHSHGESKMIKRPQGKDFKPGHNNKVKEEKFFVKHDKPGRKIPTYSWDQKGKIDGLYN